MVELIKSQSLKACRRKGHEPIRHSPDGFNIILECKTCLACWQIQGITGEELRLADTYSLRVFTAKY